MFHTFDRMYAAFGRDRELIPANQFAEVRYEDLVKAPITQMQRIYETLGLDKFDEARPAIEQYLQSQADYKTNRYELSPETHAWIAERWSGFMKKYGYTPATQAADEPKTNANAASVGRG